MTSAYIDIYKELARDEMKRSGIPASITLAQGILESRSGQSRLAVEGNNHFGIKCHKEWSGKSIREDDDARNECFRKYSSAEESFRDHSDFLMTRERYASLFAIPREDYQSWANGLKQAGYATSPTYAQSLIGLIQRYELYRYDLDDLPVAMVRQDEGKQPMEGCLYATNVFFINRIKAVFMQPGETLFDIARKNEKREPWLVSYNEVSGDNRLSHGMHVFLQPKRRKAEVKFHKVKDDETMYEVSQLYGVKVTELYRRNRMTPGEEPAQGEVLYMRSRRSEPPRLRTPRSEAVPEPEEEAFQPLPPEDTMNEGRVQSAPSPEEKGLIENLTNTPVSEEPVFEPKHIFPGHVEDGDLQVVSKPLAHQNEALSVVYRYHEVSQGETLYSLSRQYGVTVDLIKHWNALPDNTINIGQTIIVGIEE